MKGTIYALCLAAAVAVVIAGCGSGETSSTSSEGDVKPASSTGAAGSGIAVISAAEVGNLGTVLVDSDGHTLYSFSKDEHSLYSAFSSGCYGACAQTWSPLLSEGEPDAKNGAFPTKLSLLERREGTLQVTYYGHPLYIYASDQRPGEANGNDISQFGGKWYALRPDGQEPKG